MAGDRSQPTAGQARRGFTAWMFHGDPSVNVGGMMAEKQGDDKACLSCRQEAAADLPPRERVLHTQHWRVAHAFDSGLPGWLVLLPTRHVVALDQLTEDEVVELGPILRELTAALRVVVGCQKTYVMLFAEAEGFEHLHFHVVPKMPDQPETLRGPRIFGMLGQPLSARVPTERMDEIAVAIGEHLPSPS